MFKETGGYIEQEPQDNQEDEQPKQEVKSSTISRRSFLRTGGEALAAAAVLSTLGKGVEAAPQDKPKRPREVPKVEVKESGAQQVQGIDTTHTTSVKRKIAEFVRNHASSEAPIVLPPYELNFIELKTVDPKNSQLDEAAKREAQDQARKNIPKIIPRANNNTTLGGLWNRGVEALEERARKKGDKQIEKVTAPRTGDMTLAYSVDGEPSSIRFTFEREENGITVRKLFWDDGHSSKDLNLHVPVSIDYKSFLADQLVEAATHEKVNNGRPLLASFLAEYAEKASGGVK